MPRHPPCTLSSLTTFTDHRHTGQVSRPVPYCRPSCPGRRTRRGPYRGLTEKVLDSFARDFDSPVARNASLHCGPRLASLTRGESCNTQKNLERQNYSLVKELHTGPITRRALRSRERGRRD